ncbi:hypothetical protein GCM10009854_08550 [Saccharopolyspora halophila]|uniref:DUF6802 domain-containing protein n=1 Tax=Saccharopolyspora halophila TaxID=405551 RepID=A0ABN3FPX5_9PSEU
MYIEETGAGDGDIKVTVDGEDYTAEANYDLDGDGMDDTIAVMTGDGFVAYIDEDSDGRADVLQSINDNGDVTEQARFDPGTGQWIGERPGNHPDPGGHDRREHDERSLVIDTGQGERQVGLPTEDTNSDGIADTAMVEGEDGATMMVTDLDGDGSADQVVEVSSSGDITISHHTGEGQWTVVEQGKIGDDGRYAPDPHTAATDDATWTFDEPEPQQPVGEHAEQPGQHASAADDRPRAHRGGAAAPDSDAVWE